MKYLFSISFILIYLLGSLQSSWVLIDFYWNREDYTQKYCQFLDVGITQCRASCYLDDLLEEKNKEPAKAHVNPHQKVKVTEIINDDRISFYSYAGDQNLIYAYPSGQYHFEFYDPIFHPPKV